MKYYYGGHGWVNSERGKPQYLVSYGHTFKTNPTRTATGQNLGLNDRLTTNCRSHGVVSLSSYHNHDTHTNWTTLHPLHSDIILSHNLNPLFLQTICVMAGRAVLTANPISCVLGSERFHSVYCSSYYVLTHHI